MVCKYCDDGHGHSVYPYYGVAPHQCHDFKSIGSATELPRSEWPENFRPDPDAMSKGEGTYPGCGVYTHCLQCGEGEPVSALSAPDKEVFVE